jgi:hypothetical protein
MGKNNTSPWKMEGGGESVKAEERSLLSPECGLFGDDVWRLKSVMSGTQRQAVQGWQAVSLM